MNLARWSIEKMTLTLFVVILLTIGGVYSYFRMGKLEDPEFTIKIALVTTSYPGASARQVELEVTDVIEAAAQRLDEVDFVTSISRPGLSIVFVHLFKEFTAGEIPQIWDELRKKVQGVQAELPPGAEPSVVLDDFGDVFGVLLAITGDGHSYAQLKEYAEEIQCDLLGVKHVAQVRLWGEQVECVYVEPSRARLAELGVPPQLILATLNRQNAVVDGGTANFHRERLRFDVTGEFDSVEEIGNLIIRGFPSDQLIHLKDIAEIKRGYFEPPVSLMRFNGRPAIGLAIAATARGNVIEMGRLLTERLEELQTRLPVGVEIHTVSYQPFFVDEAINEFTFNLLAAVVIILVLLLISIGLSSGLLIGGGLVLTILGTFVAMSAMGIELHRVSLGALIVALGMIVDNAIVVTEGTLINIQRGRDRIDSANRVVNQTAWPLLGATLIAALAFMPIYISRDNASEYAGSLFLVIATSLLISWGLAMTAIPVGCYLFLRPPKGDRERDVYDRPIYRKYRGLLVWSLDHRVLVLVVIVALFVGAIIGFMFVPQLFFPESRRPQLIVEYWLAEGSRIEAVSEDLRSIEAKLMEHPKVVNVASFIGSGPPRFYLPMETEIPRPSFGQLIINVEDADVLESVIAYVRHYLNANYPYAEPRVRRFPLGPAERFKIEGRFSGPNVEVLRDLAEQAKAIMRRDPYAVDVRDDWRQRVKKMTVVYSQPRGRRGSLGRADIGMSLQRSFDGMITGVYREGTELLPIIVRGSEAERRELANLEALPVWGMLSVTSVPLGQAVSELLLEWESPLILRRDRRRTITAQCDPLDVTAKELIDRIGPEIEAIELPRGYTFEWGGEHEASTEAQQNLFDGLPISGMLMALILVALFNDLRKSLMIVLLLPLAMIGISFGLLVTRVPFSFMALIGGLSLTGMLIKNAVVLVDQVGAELGGGKDGYEAVIDGSINRMRPVLLASMTTVLGLVPLIFDEFWRSLAVTIAFGLSFAAVLTLVVLPVLYSLFFRYRRED